MAVTMQMNARRKMTFIIRGSPDAAENSAGCISASLHANQFKINDYINLDDDIHLIALKKRKQPTRAQPVHVADSLCYELT